MYIVYINVQDTKNSYVQNEKHTFMSQTDNVI